VLASIDTFREDIARASIAADASCIIYVYAFTALRSSPPIEATGAVKVLACGTGVVAVLMDSHGEGNTNMDYSPLEAIRGKGESRG
jgi:hypothetical protein